jgi:thiamine biosynthesis lipoprotein ApbE
MLYFSRFAAGLLVALAACAVTVAAGAAEDFSFYHENVLGTSLELCVRAESLRAAQAAEDRTLREIDRLSAIFSGHDPSSEFSRWQATLRNPVRVSSELFDVLQAAEHWVHESGGAFDPGVEALTRLWARCADRDRVPDVLELEQSRALMRSPAWRLDPSSGTAERLSVCPLSLNGIAKGYIVERACAAALGENGGVSGVLLNAGGDLRTRGEPLRTIGIAAPWADSESSEPFTYIEVKDRSVATSGSSQRGFRIGGNWYSHIFDPRTGLPVERVASATVVAKRASDADALAKVCSVLAPEESLRLVRSLPDVEVLILERDGRVTRSDGWQRLQRPRPVWLAVADDAKKPAAATNADAAKKPDQPATPPPWNKELELVVNFEINRPEAEPGRYRRPYVAVWVEDKDGHSVRTLVLWVSMGGSGPFQWLPDLKRWHQTDLERKRTDKEELVFTISRPTRQPGKYKAIWDGKDNHGKQLAGGEYTITIEAAREHGTYQSIRKQVSVAGKPFVEELKGNVEIKSASIEYRRKAAAK